MVNKEKLIMVAQYSAIGLLIIGIGVISYFIYKKSKKNCKPKCVKNKCGPDGCGGTCPCSDIDPDKFKCNKDCLTKKEMSFSNDSRFLITNGVLEIIKGNTNLPKNSESYFNTDDTFETKINDKLLKFTIVSKIKTHMYKILPNHININDTTRSFSKCVSKCIKDKEGIYKSMKECNTGCNKYIDPNAKSTCTRYCDPEYADNKVMRDACNKNCDEYPCWSTHDKQCAHINNKEECDKVPHYEWCG